MDKLEKWRGFVPDDELANFAKGAFAKRLGRMSRARSNRH